MEHHAGEWIGWTRMIDRAERSRGFYWKILIKVGCLDKFFFSYSVDSSFLPVLSLEIKHLYFHEIGTGSTSL